MTNTIPQRLQQLRTQLRQATIDYYLVPSADPHNSEYVPECWQRRAWISGFTGSAGTALIGLNQAFLWTDPRYFLQAETELDPQVYTLIKMTQVGAPSLGEWLLSQPTGIRFGVDPKVISIRQAQEIQLALAENNGEIIYLNDNLVDQVWHDQPPIPNAKIRLYDIAYAGQTSYDKLSALRNHLKNHELDAIVINTLDAIAWLFNIRGDDVKFNPVVISNAVITLDDAYFFVDTRKLCDESRLYFEKNNITVRSYDEFGQALQALQGNISIDPSTANIWIKNQLINSEAYYEVSPINLLKSIKNPVEQRGMRAAHEMDAIAVIKFLHWLDNHWHNGITEISAAEKLEFFRHSNPDCLDLSFNTISGFAAHGAIIHYAVDEKSNITIDDSSLYLVDSGGQYLTGTTDITRTIHLGQPTEEQKKHYTLVLQGHLALRHITFPIGTCGEHLNVLAHAPLWRHALDYGHGTGHGVGAYLCVHEFPPVISARASNIPLQAGMVVSNEPGVYFSGQYGIRIENLILVKPIFDTEQSLSGHGPFLGFEDLTLVPYCRKLINVALLSKEEIIAINSYHQKIYTILKNKFTDQSVISWLAEATKPL